MRALLPRNERCERLSDEELDKLRDALALAIRAVWARGAGTVYFELLRPELFTLAEVTVSPTSGFPRGRIASWFLNTDARRKVLLSWVPEWTAAWLQRRLAWRWGESALEGRDDLNNRVNYDDLYTPVDAEP